MLLLLIKLTCQKEYALELRLSDIMSWHDGKLRWILKRPRSSKQIDKREIVKLGLALDLYQRKGISQCHDLVSENAKRKCT